MGFGPSKRVAEMVGHYETNIAISNYSAHLTSFQSTHLCASVSNLLISESDSLNAYWRDELFTVLSEVDNGYVKIPTGSGWGTDLREEAARKWARAP